MIKSKKQMFIVIGVFTLVMLLGTITYAFFNYTRTGSPNTIKVGKISFNSTQNNTINLTNVFPTDSEHLDNTNSSTVTINITGDTTYDNGIEYKVSLEQVNNTINNKEVPISFSVEASNLGRKSSDYYNERGLDENVYNLRESGIAENGKDILIGYIKPDNNGVNGSVSITAYIDKDEIAISDTVSRIENNSLVYGETSGEWIEGRTVLTTTEWNSLQSNGISFRVKVEANEGIWVAKPKHNVLKKLSDVTGFGTSEKSSITSIEFITNPTVPASAIATYDATDITSEGPVTIYTLDDGLGNNTYKLVICSDDEIYSVQNSMTLFARFDNMVTFNGSNFRTDDVTNMKNFFRNNTKLTNLIGLDNWNTSNVQDMSNMFRNCPSLINVDALKNWNTSNLKTMSYMFAGCSSLANVNGLLNWDTSSVEDITYMFAGCSSLANVNGLANWDTSSVANMMNMFEGCTSLTNVNGLANWNVSSVEHLYGVFYECNMLQDISGLRNWNTSNVEYMALLFYRCSNLSDISPLSKWDTSNVESMSYMFCDCLSLVNVLGLANWNVGSVVNMQFMFGLDAGTSKVNNAIVDFSPLANWNVSNVTNMEAMFQNVNISSYQAFKNWNVSKVQNFSNMFNQTSASTVTTLTGLENWDVSSATDMKVMFSDNVSLTDASAINNWNINSSIDFTSMFGNTPVHPEFVKVPGTWDSEGTFTPNA